MGVSGPNQSNFTSHGYIKNVEIVKNEQIEVGGWSFAREGVVIDHDVIVIFLLGRFY